MQHACYAEGKVVVRGVGNTTTRDARALISSTRENEPQTQQPQNIDRQQNAKVLFYHVLPNAASFNVQRGELEVEGVGVVVGDARSYG